MSSQQFDHRDRNSVNPWFVEADMSRFVALIIDALNITSIGSPLIKLKIRNLLRRYNHTNDIDGGSAHLSRRTSQTTSVKIEATTISVQQKKNGSIS